MLRFLTGGESHGEALSAILEGMPAGLKIDAKTIDEELVRRQKGYGRGERMKLEKDHVKIISGLKKGVTLGSPLTLIIENKDFSIERLPEITRPRPGHADLAGAIKYGYKDIRNVLERASARETATRVAVGAICKIFLAEFRIEVLSHVVMIGNVKAHTEGMSFEQIEDKSQGSTISCADDAAEKIMLEEIDKARDSGDSLGGTFEVILKNVPAGLGNYIQWDRRLDAAFSGAIMSIPGIKVVEIGQGIEVSRRLGSKSHDEIFFDKERGYFRKTNFAGGIEGGLSNGENIILKGYMKPISTLKRPLSSVDILTKEKVLAQVERADVCAVPSAGVIAEAMSAYVISNAILDKFGGDSIFEIKRGFDSYLESIKR